MANKQATQMPPQECKPLWSRGLRMHSSDPRLTLKRNGLGLVVALVACTSLAWACNIPVFRYALERWRPDVCEVIVFHEHDLTASQLQELAKLKPTESAGAELNPKDQPNVAVIQSRIGQDPNPRNRDLWETLKKTAATELPYVVVRTTVSDKRAVNSWHGPLAKFNSRQLLDSPMRRELSRRLLSGHAVVWLLVGSSDATKNAKAKQMLTTELKQLSKTIDFPEGLGLPGSELYAEIPLLMEFSILEVDPKDPQEAFLLGLFHGFHPDANTNGQPLLVPVFGRGRALEVIPADRLDADLIGDLTRYLCGACSCQVKERNPGFDLLVATPWERELFGEDGELPPPPKEFDPTTAPTLLTIPPGKQPASNTAK